MFTTLSDGFTIKYDVREIQDMFKLSCTTFASDIVLVFGVLLSRLLSSLQQLHTTRCSSVADTVLRCVFYSHEIYVAFSSSRWHGQSFIRKPKLTGNLRWHIQMPWNKSPMRQTDRHTKLPCHICDACVKYAAW